MFLQDLERRFGITAVRMGLITAEQLIEAISIQIKEELDDEKHRLIGEILYQKRFLTEAQIKDVLTSLGISTRLLSRALNYGDKADVQGIAACTPAEP